MGEVTFNGVFFGENCPEASIHGSNCPGVFLEGNFLGKQLYRRKAVFLGSNCPGWDKFPREQLSLSAIIQGICRRENCW